MDFTINTQIQSGLSLHEQTAVFQAWFNENCMPHITFGNGIDSEKTCTDFDQYGRPSKWVLRTVTVEAVYFTENENYSFNKFMIYGTV